MNTKCKRDKKFDIFPTIYQLYYTYTKINNVCLIQSGMLSFYMTLTHEFLVLFHCVNKKLISRLFTKALPK